MILISSFFIYYWTFQIYFTYLNTYKINIFIRHLSLHYFCTEREKNKSLSRPAYGLIWSWIWQPDSQIKVVYTLIFCILVWAKHDTALIRPQSECTLQNHNIRRAKIGFNPYYKVSHFVSGYLKTMLLLLVDRKSR